MTTPAGTALILVAILKDRRDFEIARLLGWYRIPLRSAPKVVNVDYLAFYQTSGFGEESRWKVEYIAPVRGVELTTRAELLKDEPAHPRAHEEYYKIQLGPLQRLPCPIMADKWRRVTFFYTTGELLSTARILADLAVPSEEREILWHSLRERAQQGNWGGAEPDPELDPAWLTLLSGLSGFEGIRNREGRQESET